MNRRGFLAFVAALPVARAIPAMPIMEDAWSLTESNLEDVLIEISKITDSRGLMINVMPTLIVPSENYLEALRLVRKNADY